MCNEVFCGPPGHTHSSRESSHHKGGLHGFGAGCCVPFDMKTIGRMARRFMHGFAKSHEGWVPYNLEDKGDYYVIMVPLSGRTKEDVKVSLINSTLNITAEKPKSAEGEEKKKKDEIPFMRNFFTFVDVNLDIPLPADADKDSIKSLMQNGLLRVKIGKKPPKNININEEPNN